MIVLIRNDDRLVHGQCMTRIVQHYKLQHIIVIDDGTASNPILKLVCEKAAMGNYKIEVFSTENYIEAVTNAVSDNLNTMLVFRFPTVAKLLFDTVEGLPKEMMVGPCQIVNEGDIEVNTGSFVSKEYAEIFNYLKDEYDVNTFFQPVPDMKRVDWEDVKSKF